MSPRRRSRRAAPFGRSSGRARGPSADPSGPRTRRLPALMVLGAVLLAGGIVDRRAERAATDGSSTINAQVPLGAPASARSSAWYCPGAPVTGALGEASVVVANAGSRRLTGTVTVYPNTGESRRAPIAVGPSSRTAVRLADLATAPFASALIELDGGDAVAEVATTGALGDSVASCASSASSSWYFAEGVTTRDASELLLALNPFPDDAVVDVVFSTEEGTVSPQALTGLLVRGQAVTAINVGEFVQRRESVSTSLVARTGRLVVSRVQTFDGTAGRKGVSVGLGAAAPGPVWYFPEGLVTDGLAERYLVYNPGPTEAQVELALALETGEAEPLRLTIPRESRLAVVASEESRIPKNVPHAVTVRVVEGPDVVVERAVDGVAPSARTGLSLTLGARLPALRWATAAGAADDNNDQWVIVQNPGTLPARVTLNLLADGNAVAVGSFTAIEVAPGQRRAFHINDTIRRAATPIILTSTREVIVERAVYRIKAPGLAMSAAIPLRWRSSHRTATSDRHRSAAPCAPDGDIGSPPIRCPHACRPLGIRRPGPRKSSQRSPAPFKR